MRIERISDTQLKFVLIADDLRERDIKVSELSYASDKTQELFREIMTLVQDEDEFVEGETPLMFEAMRVGVDSLVVIVTKISEGIENEQRFNLIPAARRECRYKKSGYIQPPPAADGEPSHSIFAFESLDILADAVKRLPLNFIGESRVHKMDGKFFLLLINETEDLKTTAELEAPLHEFGQKHISNEIARQYLFERGEVIIAENAVEKMCAYGAF